jgi:hypothetical protein
MLSTFAPTSGSATMYGNRMQITVNQTGSANGFYSILNMQVTETALLNASPNYFIRGQSGSTGSTTQFTIDSVGNAQFAGAVVAGSITVSSPTAGVFYSGTTPGVSAGSFSAITAIQTTGGIVTSLTGTSDERLKENIRPFSRGLEAIVKLSPKLFQWNEEGRAKTGFSEGQEFAGLIAQNLQEAIPEAVGLEDGKWLTVSDRPIIAALINAVKELSARIEQLESRGLG